MVDWYFDKVDSVRVVDFVDLTSNCNLLSHL